MRKLKILVLVFVTQLMFLGGIHADLLEPESLKHGHDLISKYLTVMPEGCWETDRSVGYVAKFEIPGQPPKTIPSSDMSKNIYFTLYKKSGRLWGFNTHKDFFVAKEPFTIMQISKSELLGTFHQSILKDGQEPPYDVSWYRTRVLRDRIVSVSEDPTSLVKTVERVRTGANKLRVQAELAGGSFPTGTKYTFDLIRGKCR